MYFWYLLIERVLVDFCWEPLSGSASRVGGCFDSSYRAPHSLHAYVEHFTCSFWTYAYENYTWLHVRIEDVFCDVLCVFTWLVSISVGWVCWACLLWTTIPLFWMQAGGLKSCLPVWRFEDGHQPADQPGLMANGKQLQPTFPNMPWFLSTMIINDPSSSGHRYHRCTVNIFAKDIINDPILLVDITSIKSTVFGWCQHGYGSKWTPKMDGSFRSETWAAAGFKVRTWTRWTSSLNWREHLQESPEFEV